MYLFDYKATTNLWHYICWCRLYAEDRDIFETEETFDKKTKQHILWVWLRDVDDPLNDEDE